MVWLLTLQFVATSLALQTVRPGGIVTRATRPNMSRRRPRPAGVHVPVNDGGLLVFTLSEPHDQVTLLSGSKSKKRVLYICARQYRQQKQEKPLRV